MFSFSQNLFGSQIVPSAHVKKANTIYCECNCYNENKNKNEKNEHIDNFTMTEILSSFSSDNLRNYNISFKGLKENCLSQVQRNNRIPAVSVLMVFL